MATFPFKGSDGGTYAGELYSAGRKASAGSAPVVLSTEQEAILQAIATAVAAAQVVSGTVTVGNSSLAVTGPATDAQMRASAIPVSLAAAPLPSGASTATLQTDLKTLLTSLQSQNATALARFPTYDAQMAALVSALDSVTLTANQNIGISVGNFPVSSSNRVPVDTREQLTPVNRSSTITAGGTAKVLAAANTSRKGFEIQNQSAGPLYVNELGTATLDQNSLKIEAGAFWEWPGKVPTSALSIIGATTGQAFYAREW